MTVVGGSGEEEPGLGISRSFTDDDDARDGLIGGIVKWEVTPVLFWKKGKQMYHLLKSAIREGRKRDRGNQEGI
jgi:hypothetical protein